MKKDVLNFLRVKQWYKNLVIFLPLIFSLKLSEIDDLIKIFIGFFILTIISVSAYIRNDVKDKDFDVNHPSKKYRLIASGKISIRNAKIISIALLVSGILLAYVLEPMFCLLTVLLFLNTEFYTRWTKNIIFVDVFSIAINFILRSMAGVVLIDVFLSPWLILGVFFVALFLGLLKRKSEYLESADPSLFRKNLKVYDLQSINSSILLSGVMIVVTYSLYTIYNNINHTNLILTVPIVVFIILKQIHTSNGKSAGMQSEHLFKDKMTKFAFILLAIMTLVILYLDVIFENLLTIL